MLALFSGSLFDWARAWGLTYLVTLSLFSLALFLCNLFFLCFLFADVPSLLYLCFAVAYLHLAVFLNILSLTYHKKKSKILLKIVCILMIACLCGCAGSSRHVYCM